MSKAGANAAKRHAVLRNVFAASSVCRRGVRAKSCGAIGSGAGGGMIEVAVLLRPSIGKAKSRSVDRHSGAVAREIR